MSYNQKPQTEEEYIVWSRNNQCGDFNDAIKRQYNFTQIVAAQTVNNHPFFTGLNQFLQNAAIEYFDQKNFHLLMDPVGSAFKLVHKSYASALDKVFRLNVVKNANFPQAPEQGWVTPENWFALLDDVLRGTIACKYIDGPGIVSELLVAYARSHNLKGIYETRQLDRGYYAYHFYVDIPVEISDLSYNQVNVDLTVEIQLTTQLQEVMYQITHKHYTEGRSKLETERESWKWEVKTSRFKAGYLAHTLHLLEAIILELRDSFPTQLDVVRKEVSPRDLCRQCVELFQYYAFLFSSGAAVGLGLPSLFDGDGGVDLDFNRALEYQIPTVRGG